MPSRGAASAILLALLALACGRISSSRAPQAELWYVASPTASAPERSATGLILLDTASLRPVAIAATSPAKNRVAIFTSFQGSRYHPEAVRALAEDSSVLAGFGRAFDQVSAPAERALIVDLQDMSPDDIPQMTAVLRALGAVFRATRRAPVAVVVPAGDTVAYPTAILGRVADLLVVRLTDEHRPGTRPGPLVTRDFIRRALGARATNLGASRLGAEFPLYGYIWNRDGSARPITFREASDLVIRESSTFRRDPPSGFLTATGRDGWTIWVPDARTVRILIDTALERGARVVALAGITGADPAVFAGDSVTR